MRSRGAPNSGDRYVPADFLLACCCQAAGGALSNPRGPHLHPGVWPHGNTEKQLQFASPLGSLLYPNRPLELGRGPKSTLMAPCHRQMPGTAYRARHSAEPKCPVPAGATVLEPQLPKDLRVVRPADWSQGGCGSRATRI